VKEDDAKALLSPGASGPRLVHVNAYSPYRELIRDGFRAGPSPKILTPAGPLISGTFFAAGGGVALPRSPHKVYPAPAAV
jgi:hypothetical protein